MKNQEAILRQERIEVDDVSQEKNTRPSLLSTERIADASRGVEDETSRLAEGVAATELTSLAEEIGDDEDDEDEEYGDGYIIRR